MVVDRNMILEMMRSSEDDLKAHKDEDSILITTRDDNFSKDDQIGNDSIDLRICDYGYVIKNNYEYINTLSDENFEKYFEKVELHMNGYNLEPGAILFIETLERIHLVGDIIGRICGRSTFSRFGLSVHCTQEKFSSGINSIAALQIKNNTNTTLKIFPYQKLAQLIIEKTSPGHQPYNGTFSVESSYQLPVIKDKDRVQYDQIGKEKIKRMQPRKRPIGSRRDDSAKLNTLVQGILGFLITVAVAVLGFMEDKTWAIGITVFLAVVYIFICWYFYRVSNQYND